jgi:hypothetical protein
MRVDNLKAFSDDELADLWYALGCSVKEFGFPFKGYMEVAFEELVSRQGANVTEFLTHRKSHYRLQPDQRSAVDTEPL